MVAFFIYIASMFSTPTIPTDSLYKFLFVGGIVLMIASFYFTFKNQTNHLTAYNKFDSLQTDIIFKQNIMYKRLKNSVINLDTLQKRVKINPNYLNSFKEELGSDSTDIKNLQHKSNNIDLNQKFEETFYQNTKLCLIIMQILGCVMGIIGAIFWSLKIQFYQDELLRLEVELKRKEVKIK